MWLKPYFKGGLRCAGTENITRRPIVMPKDWSAMADRKVVAEAAASALGEMPERAPAE
jgi:hypothetical protein